MYPGVKPEHHSLYLCQANERLDDLSGEPLEDILRRVITEYCALPFVAQQEIDRLISLLPRIDKSPPLDAVYAAQTLLRARHAIADLLAPSNSADTVMAMFADSTEDKDADIPWQPTDDDDNATAINNSLWGDQGSLLDEDIRRSAFRRRMIENDDDSTSNETMLHLSDIPDPVACFRLATRRLSVGIIDSCTGQQSLNQYRAVVSRDFPRIQPLFLTSLSSPDTVASIAYGLITDINALPDPRG